MEEGGDGDKGTGRRYRRRGDGVKDTERKYRREEMVLKIR